MYDPTFLPTDPAPALEQPNVPLIDRESVQSQFTMQWQQNTYFKQHLSHILMQHQTLKTLVESLEQEVHDKFEA